jgi:hypothetical protein
MAPGWPGWLAGSQASLEPFLKEIDDFYKESIGWTPWISHISHISDMKKMKKPQKKLKVFLLFHDLTVPSLWIPYRNHQFP